MNRIPKGSSLRRSRVSLAAIMALWAVVGMSAMSAKPVAATAAPSSFHFTVTSDLHSRTNLYGLVLDAMHANSGGQGAFQVSVGDVVNSARETPEALREVIDRHFGTNAVWYPVVGNHDKGAVSMQWHRAEFNTGNGIRTPLTNLIAYPGPPGSVETTYSWDFANAHFVALNEYWNGKTASGSDTATDGDIDPPLCHWLEADLAANTKPFVFVFGHEPAFPQHRHLGDSLDKYATNREVFWNVLNKYHVQAFVSGHIHYYYTAWRDGVCQICDGAVGRDNEKHQTYLDVIVGPGEARVKVWQNDSDGSTTWHLADTITLTAPTTSAQPSHSTASQR
jgi:hypothetical protein